MKEFTVILKLTDGTEYETECYQLVIKHNSNRGKNRLELDKRNGNMQIRSSGVMQVVPSATNSIYVIDNGKFGKVE